VASAAPTGKLGSGSKPLLHGSLSRERTTLAWPPWRRSKAWHQGRWVVGGSPSPAVSSAFLLPSHLPACSSILLALCGAN